MIFDPSLAPASSQVDAENEQKHTQFKEALQKIEAHCAGCDLDLWPGVTCGDLG